MKSTCDVALQHCMSQCWNRSRLEERQLYTLIAVQHTGLASDSPESSYIAWEQTCSHVTSLLCGCLFIAAHRSQPQTGEMQTFPPLKCLVTLTITTLLFGCWLSHIEWLFPPPSPCVSRLPLSMAETPAPQERGSCSAAPVFKTICFGHGMFSLTSAVTLPRAFAPVSTKNRISVALSHGMRRTSEAVRCHKRRRVISHLCRVTESWKMRLNFHMTFWNHQRMNKANSDSRSA